MGAKESQDKLTKFIKGYSSRCICCNKVLSDTTFSLNKFTGEMEPICSHCKWIIKTSQSNFYNDQEEVETEVWGKPLGTVTLDDYCDVESVYQGYE